MSRFLISIAAVAGLAASARAQVVFNNLSNNGFFTPFNSANASTVRYGDSGWLSSGGAPGIELGQIELGLATFGNAGAGTTDLIFTFNDGDPSGLVFGSGNALYTTVLTGVQLPAATSALATFFSLTIPLPGVVTAGGFNNIGWSVALANYNYAGSFGFQCSTASGQTNGFYTSNASFYNGSQWSLFSFGGDPNTGVANFVATVSIPAPGAAAGLLLGAGLLTRRRR